MEEMNIPLREWDLDILGLEAVVDTGVNLVNDHQPPIEGGEEEADGEIEGAVSEGFEGDHGFRILEDVRMRLDDVPEDADGLLDVRAIGNTHIDDDTIQFVGERPVEDMTGDEGLVGDHEILPVPVSDGGGADPDF